MERKKRSKGSVWEFCYANKIFGTFGIEMRACGQKFVKFCTLTHTHTHTTAAKLVVRWYSFVHEKSKEGDLYLVDNVENGIILSPEGPNFEGRPREN